MLSLCLQRLAARFACLAVLFGALAPTLTHALVKWRGQPAAWADICTGYGSKTVALAIDAPPGDPAPRPIRDSHCPFCANQAGSFALPPSVQPPLPRAVGHKEIPPPLHLAPRPLRAWAAAQPRAPPIAS